MRRTSLCVTFFVLLFQSLSSTAFCTAKPFFSWAESSGIISVKIYPMENVSPGVPQLVTFGMPFPRKSVTSADLAKVRVMKDGAEISACVESLTPWRHTRNPAIDAQSVRIARIQIHYTFSTSYPNYEEIQVEWGITTRTQNVSVMENPRNGWHLVSQGTFDAADNVYEPDVYAVLPKEHLTKGLLRPMRMKPFSKSVPEAREDPSEMAAVEHWPGFQEQQHAVKNNFYSTINEDDPAVLPEESCNYKTDYEPWLYDRSSAMFGLYFRSGFLKPLREAVRSTQFYFNHLDADGFFDLKPEQDSKDSYNECLAYAYWLTGDDLMLAKIPVVLKAHQDMVSRWGPKLNFWTERHVAFKLLANVVAYEVLGDAASKSNIQTILRDLAWHQDGAGGRIPASRVDGALYHYGFQHDWDWDENALGASPWMTALLVDAVVRVYAFSGDARTANFIRRVGNFEKNSIRVTTDHMYENYEYGELSLPNYGMLVDGSLGRAEWGDEEHALDVASALAWAAYFAELKSLPDPTLKLQAKALYFTYDIGVNYWIRPQGPEYGKPAFRVSPWRKYSWEHRVSPSFSWLMNQL